MEERLLKIFNKQFNGKLPQQNDRICKDSIQQWDSLAHLRLIMAIEKEFGCRFNTTVIPTLTAFDTILTEIKKIPNNG